MKGFHKSWLCECGFGNSRSIGNDFLNNGRKIDQGHECFIHLSDQHCGIANRREYSPGFRPPCSQGLPVCSCANPVLSPGLILSICKNDRLIQVKLYGPSWLEHPDSVQAIWGLLNYSLLHAERSNFVQEMNKAYSLTFWLSGAGWGASERLCLLCVLRCAGMTSLHPPWGRELFWGRAG